MEHEIINLSVIIPVFNTEDYLKKCIESLKNQKPVLEIIIINDGSTDRSGMIADELSQEDPRIKVIHQENRGLATTRNRGIDVAKGEYIFFLDSDDWVKDNSLAYLYAEASKYQSDVVMGNSIYCYADEQVANPFGKIAENIIGIPLTGKQCFIELMKTSSYVPMVCNYIFKREFLQSQHFRFENIIHEDELWTPVVLCSAKRTMITDFDFYCYRQQRENSITYTFDPGKRLLALFFISGQLVSYTDRFTFEGDDREFKSWLYVNIFRLYTLAFDLLLTTKDSSFILPEHHLSCWERINHNLTAIPRKKVENYYLKSTKTLKEYEKWFQSEWVTIMKQAATDEKTIVLVYNTMWGEELNISMEDIPENMIITTDRKYLVQADVVVFHLPDLFNNMNIDISKREGQLWVAWYLESEKNYPWFRSTEISNWFDLKMSYRQDADVVYPYYQYEYPNKLKYQVPLGKKLNKACMFISSHVNNSRRMEYLKELMNYTDIDSFGKLYNNKQLPEDKGLETKMVEYRKYKFVISFENAIDTDYVTEKFYDPLLSGTVPVYLGAPNINDFSPGDNCFVDVRKFDSPKALAGFINHCYEDDQSYAQFFEWKNRPLKQSFLQKTEGQKERPLVRLCWKIKDKLFEEECNKKKIKQLGNIYLCSFGDSRYSESRKRLIEQAENMQVFSECFMYNENELDELFRQQFAGYLNSNVRGFGYWIWKPQVILQSLDKINDNDVLLYLDMGTHLNFRGRKRFIEYWETVKKSDIGILVNVLEDFRLERYWTKGDVLDYFKVRYCHDIVDSPQYQGGLIFIRKKEKTIDLIRKWLEIFKSDYSLVDDSPSVSPNLNGFVSHRHDQSVLSVLLKINGACTIPVEETYNTDWDVLEKEFPILHKRDLQ